MDKKSKRDKLFVQLQDRITKVWEGAMSREQLMDKILPEIKLMELDDRELLEVGIMFSFIYSMMAHGGETELNKHLATITETLQIDRWIFLWKKSDTLSGVIVSGLEGDKDGQCELAQLVNDAVNSSPNFRGILAHAVKHAKEDGTDNITAERRRVVA